MNLSGSKQRGRHSAQGGVRLPLFDVLEPFMKSIAVIGGGITGVTSAYALAKRGLNVTLFEQNRYAAMETSFANGGQLSASNAEVWTHWSTLLKG
jgi:succinate dehydrogenase/fumarate reductase flavoprotein subunit